MTSGKPISILLTVRELHHGGIERDVTKIAMQLDRSKFEPHVASYHAEGMRFEELRRSNVPVFQVPVTSLKSLATMKSAIRLGQYIRKHQIQLVHAYDPSAVFAVPVARASRVPVVLASTLGHRDLLDQRTHRQLRWTDKMVDAVVVNCEAMRRHMIDEEHFPAKRIELCYNGVDTREFFPLQTSKPDGDSFVIGTICVLRPEKALDVLQGAFARIRHLNSRMKLLIVGSGPELSQLQANSVRLGIQGASVFLPATVNVAKFLNSIDIFVLCSRSEAFSNALLEAMACGRCVVGSRVGGTPELLGKDERGLLFRTGDPVDLAEKLSILVANEQLRRELAVRAADFARAKLNVEIAVSRMADIYEIMLGAKSCVVNNQITRREVCANKSH